ncbi:MAG: hypothetical protein Sylvanvirus1_84 [Sylvanvirus sp.]|uniref:Sulfhydryl oxidase n=1 Tax=Sylvanvirus sp. TaxID=2487774 RepID=A0A3G5AH78_9VIRU|nr:MAG: hypothetical protein Sylvanvirus1_84 [Sylvanvirus sp.]
MSSSAPVSRYSCGKERCPGWWGPIIWSALEIFLETYPETPTADEQQELRSWLYMTMRRLPCPEECIPHMLLLIQTYPIPTNSRTNVIEWIRFVHNKIRIKQGKPTLSSIEAAEEGHTLRHTNWSNVWKDIMTKGSLDGGSNGSSSLDAKNGINMSSYFMYMIWIMLVIVIVAILFMWLRSPSQPIASESL